MFLKSYIGQRISSELRFALIATGLLLSLAACNLSRPASPPTASTPTKTIPSQNLSRSNLIGLLFVKKDNRNNEFRGEIYPIALLLNDRYLEVSNDVTQAIRNGGSRDRILQINDQRIVTNAIKDFTIVSNHQKLGEFQVKKPVVSQFTCSAVITGQGNLQSQSSLPTIFEQLSPAGGFTGSIGQQTFDETWRSTIAISQAPTLAKLSAPSEADLARYRQAALTFGKAAIAKVANAGKVNGEASVESIQVVDLDQDGSPEIFSKVKQGSPANATQSLNPICFAAVWFSYRAGQPQLLEITQASVSLSGSQRFPYDLLETIDINHDGIQEAIVKRTGYESTSFEIYEYKNNQLDRVFQGAGYGC
jgi:hypothetical protein